MVLFCILFLSIVHCLLTIVSFAQDAPKVLVLDDSEGPIVAGDVKNASRWKVKPEEVVWENYGALSFRLFGFGHGATIAFDVKDSSGELFRFVVTDDTEGWRQVVCPFDQFVLCVEPQASLVAGNGNLDFPILSFQFKPLSDTRGGFKVDDVTLEPLN